MREYIPVNTKLIPKEARKVFEGKIWEVFQWQQEMFDGSYETFEMLRRPDTVKIITVVTNEEARRLASEEVLKLDGTESSTKIIITKQEQPRKDCFYDFPGGRHDDPKETELDAAKRELLEETGLKFRDWKLIKVEQPFAKIDWLVYTFLATGLEGWTTQSLDTGEKIEVLAMNIDDVTTLANMPESRYLEKELGSLEKLKSLPELHKY